MAIGQLLIASPCFLILIYRALDQNRRLEKERLYQGVEKKLPKAIGISTKQLLPARSKPEQIPTKAYRQHDFVDKPNMAGKAKLRKRKAKKELFAEGAKRPKVDIQVFILIAKLCM